MIVPLCAQVYQFWPHFHERLKVLSTQDLQRTRDKVTVLFLRVSGLLLVVRSVETRDSSQTSGHAFVSFRLNVSLVPAYYTCVYQILNRAHAAYS